MIKIAVIGADGQLGTDLSKVINPGEEEFKARARRPKYSVLGNEKLKAYLTEMGYIT